MWWAHIKPKIPFVCQQILEMIGDRKNKSDLESETLIGFFVKL